MKEKVVGMSLGAVGKDCQEDPFLHSAVSASKFCCRCAT